MDSVMKSKVCVHISCMTLTSKDDVTWRCVCVRVCVCKNSDMNKYIYVKTVLTKEMKR